MQSINSKFESLSLLINKLEQNCKIDTICLQETWFSSSSDTSFCSLPNFILKSKRVSAPGGLAIYLHKDHTYSYIDQARV